MMSYKIAPSSDRLGIFLDFLDTLKKFRLDAKLMMRECRDDKLKRELNSLQTTFKVLINSFYGYLGTTRHNFSDLEAASTVTAKGREILEKMVVWLESNNCKIIELDTDGIYFVGNEKIENPEEFVSLLSSTLPEGIEVEYDGDFEAMFSYKKKNYALKTRDGHLIIKGSGLKSRGLERYQREFLNELIILLMDKNGEGGEELLKNYVEDIEERRIDINLLAKTDVLIDSLENYSKKIEGGRRNRSAVYELALKSRREFRPGDQITYYITGNKKSVRAFEAAKLVTDYDKNDPDYNIPYYVDKLRKLYKKFEPFLKNESEKQGELF
jgi:DNA polymerase elongation subunit (family B)